jgi:membrane-associated phospholipid phosphatase
MYLADALPPRLCAWVRALAVVMILLVGMARVILRAHWPSDVLGGLTLGLALAAIAALLASLDHKIDHRLTEGAARSMPE